MGVYRIDADKSISLGRTSTIFQAEVMAMRQDEGCNEIHIFSNSQTAIKAPSSTIITSNTVWECLKAFKRLTRQRRVHITWIVGHNGHEGNEMADGLTRQGPYIGSEPACGIPRSLTKS